MENGKQIRLCNSCDSVQKTTLTIKQKAFEISFTLFEVKTFAFDNGSLKETDMI